MEVADLILMAPKEGALSLIASPLPSSVASLWFEEALQASDDPWRLETLAAALRL